MPHMINDKWLANKWLANDKGLANNWLANK